MHRWLVGILMVAVAPVWLSACGYQFTGGGDYPAGITTVYIEILENRSAETGVEQRFTNDLIDEFTRNRKDSLVDRRTAASGIVTGTIVSLAVDNISRSSVSTAVQRRVTGVMNLRLQSPDGRILWSSGSIVESQAFAVVSGDKTATNRNRSAAIAAVSRKLAESAFSRLTDNF